MRRALAALMLVACARPPRVTRVEVPGETRQLLVGLANGWDSVTIELIWYQRDGAAWRERARWPAVVGTGLAWGDGLHGHGAPRQAPAGDPIKREGDGRAPAGMFALGTGFGTEPPPAAARWPYRQATADLYCVDDPASPSYNQLAHAPGAWTSAEPMLRDDGLHRLGLVVEHNPARTPGHGSCIFFHVWRDADSPTVGCTALAHDGLAALLAGLDPADHPVYVLLPRDRYRTLATAWGLPPR